MDLKIDYVFPYVNNEDINWLRGYQNYRKFQEPERYRDWGTLKYVFRGIEKCMPWINNIYLIVEQESQIPQWLDREAVKIVYHKDIIPEDLLPTYNSATIEMFLHKIPGLSEHFIYSNDDIFPIRDLNPDDFYYNNLPKLAIIEKQYNPYTKNLYRHMLFNGENEIRDLLNLEKNKQIYHRTGHSLHPMLKSSWEKLESLIGKKLLRSCSRFREIKNFNQDIVAYYQWLSGNYFPSNRKTYQSQLKNINRVIQAFDSDLQIICLNDGESINLSIIKGTILGLLQKRFPTKSKYEL